MQSAISQLDLTHRSGSLQESLSGKVIFTVAASAFVALCAHISLPLPFTPVPLTLQNFAVILVGMLLGPVTGFSAMVLYLARRSHGTPRLHATQRRRYRTPARPQRRLPLLLSSGGSNRRLDCPRDAAYHHTLSRRSRSRHSRQRTHLPPRSRLARASPPHHRRQHMDHGRRSVPSRRACQDHRCRRHFQFNSTLAAVLTQPV